MMHWSADFIGIPYTEFGRERTGCDCWGLVYIIYRDVVGVTLPTYAGAYAGVEERAEISALIAGASRSPVWSPVEGPQELDVAVFRRGRLDSHVGVVISRGLMIHMAEGDCAKVERYDQAAWSHRLTGVYRHVRNWGCHDQT